MQPNSPSQSERPFVGQLFTRSNHFVLALVAIVLALYAPTLLVMN